MQTTFSEKLLKLIWVNTFLLFLLIIGELFITRSSSFSTYGGWSYGEYLMKVLAEPMVILLPTSISSLLVFARQKKIPEIILSIIVFAIATFVVFETVICRGECGFGAFILIYVVGIFIVYCIVNYILQGIEKYSALACAVIVLILISINLLKIAESKQVQGTNIPISQVPGTLNVLTSIIPNVVRQNEPSTIYARTQDGVTEFQMGYTPNTIIFTQNGSVVREIPILDNIVVNSLNFTVPDSISPGIYQISVRNKYGSTNSLNLKISKK